MIVFVAELVGLCAVAILVADAWARMKPARRSPSRIIVRNPAYDKEVEVIVRQFFREAGVLAVFTGQVTVEIQNGVVSVNESQYALGRYDGDGIVYLYADVIRWARDRKHRDLTLAQFVKRILVHELGHFLGLPHREFDRIQG